MHDLGVRMAQLFRQKYGRVAGAAARHQRTKALPERLLSGKTIVIDHRQIIEPGLDEPILLVERVTRRVRQFFVLLANLRNVVGRFHEAWPGNDAVMTN